MELDPSLQVKNQTKKMKYKLNTLEFEKKHYKCMSGIDTPL